MASCTKRWSYGFSDSGCPPIKPKHMTQGQQIQSLIAFPFLIGGCYYKPQLPLIKIFKNIGVQMHHDLHYMCFFSPLVLWNANNPLISVILILHDSYVYFYPFLLVLVSILSVSSPSSLSLLSLHLR